MPRAVIMLCLLFDFSIFSSSFDQIISKFPSMSVVMFVIPVQPLAAAAAWDDT